MTIPTKPRKYEKVWTRVKNNGSVTLSVTPFFLPRVKKAVSNEKNRDLGFKLLNDHDTFLLNFAYDTVKSTLKITLKQTAGLYGVNHGDNGIDALK